jgi:hypothetical protein
VYMYILCLCCHVFRQRPCDELITRPRSPTDCLQHEETEVKRSVSRMPNVPEGATGIKKSINSIINYVQESLNTIVCIFFKCSRVGRKLSQGIHCTCDSDQTFTTFKRKSVLDCLGYSKFSFISSF